MKKYLLTALIGLFAWFANAQTASVNYKAKADALAALKKQGKLSGNIQIHNPNGTKNLKITQLGNVLTKNNGHSSVMASSSQCNCWITPDSTFAYVPFDGSGANGPPVDSISFGNDDWSTNPIVLPFNFYLYADTVGTDSVPLFINNNGNISFGTPYSVFTAVPFPSPDYVMVAPFWGDVDTRQSTSGKVIYQLTATHLIIQWDSVEYFENETTLRNSFQLIITDGNDPILPAGYNISFCYGDMQWTTGDASSGVNGLGGFPATVGINKGDSTNYFQLSLFDTTGYTYTNPTGTPPSGVDWLDYRSFFFNTQGTANNLPPLSIGSDSTTCDTLTIYIVGDTLIQQRLAFIPPEPHQSTSITASSIDLGSNFSILSNTSGVNASLTFRVSSSGLTAGGYYHISATSTDNGTPALSTTLNYVVHVVDNTTSGIKKLSANEISIYPNPSNGSFVIEPTTNEKQTIQLIDVTGKTVLTKTINGKTIIDANNLNEGVYNISIIGTKNVINKKLVIVK